MPLQVSGAAEWQVRSVIYPLPLQVGQMCQRSLRHFFLTSDFLATVAAC